MSFADAVHAKAVHLDQLAVRMIDAAGSGHPSTALSLGHIVAVLMYHQMRYDPKNPEHPTADRLVLSEGHAVPIVYAACADLGVVADFSQYGGERRPLTEEDVMGLRAIDSPVDGHPHPQVGFPFFDAATGSLGQGLSVAAGLGCAARLDKSGRNVYCVIGDGEAREGQIWEACDFIVDEALTNVVPIFNCNALAQSDYVSPQQSSEILADKLQAYGFTVRVIDGHDPEAIKAALDELPVVQNGQRPMAIVAETVKGWGSPSDQGMGHHGKPVGEVEVTIKELDESLRDLTGGDKPNYDFKISEPAKPADAAIAGRDKPADIKAASYEQAMNAQGKGDKIGGKFAPRQAYGVALVALGEASDRIVATDADVKNSTHSEDFYKRFPDRFFENRIAEQNMISLCAGLSAGGYVPFASTFAKFVARAYDQVEMAIIGGANFKITGSHAGVTLAADGPSQMSLPDVAFFRSFCHVKNFDGSPAVRYFFPADAVSAYACTTMMANLHGCCYQRTLRANVPALYKAGDTDFAVGGHRVVREGKAMTFAAAGYMVHECLKACDEAGLDATVLDCYSLPLDADPVLEIAEKTNGKLVVVEDNYTGGLDAELAIAIARTGSGVRLQNLYVNQIPKSGRTPEAVLDYLGLDSKAIAAAVS